MVIPTNPVVRPSAIAGRWYPARPDALRTTVEDYLGRAEPQTLSGPVRALIVPHAGYEYSGPTAATAYALIRGKAYARVVLIGPLHQPIPGSPIGAFMVSSEDAYVTPLGQVPLDRTFIGDLDHQIPLTSVQGDHEHALEIQLPFLQVALAQSFTLVPIMLGEHVAAPGAAGRLVVLAGALTGLLEQSVDVPTLLIASTDLSHLHSHTDVTRIDHQLAALVAAFDIDGLAAALAEERVHACGAAGLLAVLIAARALGATDMQVLAYTTSGDMTGDRRPGTYTVGYLAAAAYG